MSSLFTTEYMLRTWFNQVVEPDKRMLAYDQTEHSALVSSDKIFYKFGQNKSHLVHESGFRHFCAEFLTGSLKSTTTKFPLNIKAEKTVLLTYLLHGAESFLRS